MDPLLNLSVRTCNILLKHNISDLQTLCKFTWAQLRALRNIGPKTCEEIQREVLSPLNLTLES